MSPDGVNNWKRHGPRGRSLDGLLSLHGRHRQSLGQHGTTRCRHGKRTRHALHLRRDGTSIRTRGSNCCSTGSKVIVVPFSHGISFDADNGGEPPGSGGAGGSGGGAWQAALAAKALMRGSAKAAGGWTGSAGSGGASTGGSAGSGGRSESGRDERWLFRRRAVAAEINVAAARTQLVALAPAGQAVPAGRPAVRRRRAVAVEVAALAVAVPLETVAPVDGQV